MIEYTINLGKPNEETCNITSKHLFPSMKPGDTIEWFYCVPNLICSPDEKLWSSTMKCWTSIGEPSLLISITYETYTWLNSSGLFRALLNDTIALTRSPVLMRVIQSL